jgi:SAM-dependent methyltransferase
MTGRHRQWNDIYLERGRVFAEPHEDIARIDAVLSNAHARRILDLGCGSGRHLVHFARLGLDAYGLDDSTEGVRLAREWLASEHLTADIRLGSIYRALPYEDGFFDAVVAVQVIHHARLAAIRQLVTEVARVLTPQGYVFVTVPAFRNQASSFEEIEPGTFIPLDGPEKGLPHHFFTADELRTLFDRFEVEDVHDDSRGHFCLSARRR